MRSVTNITRITNIHTTRQIHRQRLKHHFYRRHSGSRWLWYDSPYASHTGFSFFFGSSSWSFRFGHFYRARPYYPTWWYCTSYRPWWHYGRPVPVFYNPRYARLWHTVQVIYVPTRVTYVPSTVVQPTVSVQPVSHVVQSDPCEFTERQAWEFIAEHRTPLAYEAFECLVDVFPYDGLTLVGWSLSNAMAGRHEIAVRAMRHALHVEPDALLYVPADDRIDELMHELLIVYSHQFHEPDQQIDSLIMIASLRTVLNDTAGAHFAVSQAIEHGDQSDSAFELRKMLSDMLAKDMLQPGAP